MVAMVATGDTMMRTIMNIDLTEQRNQPRNNPWSCHGTNPKGFHQLAHRVATAPIHMIELP
jgi:hypothetical protein